jgi:hypothetical protein
MDIHVVALDKRRRDQVLFCALRQKARLDLSSFTHSGLGHIQEDDFWDEYL